ALRCSWADVLQLSSAVSLSLFPLSAAPPPPSLGELPSFLPRSLPGRSGGGGLAPLLYEAPELLAAVQAALGVDVAQVVLDRLAADEQLGGDLRVGQAAADQMGDLRLPAGQ